ncbi:MAG: tRNA pseudouridine(38-40) synthase TruA [Candidatus Omnitrophica bacterium]|nr:tRNA pseudouridine(38-40) synthase TruA [Candidatus Omnitrophota bacterium]MDD5352697.1 tRNA pseudouridine(38-40) synthase TruA [Candidatus Omnitrophota bacterium]MDD5550296.1 tRNA pseudouridine(38-40) synthase TruA [Candidatus Omnitrophota bacterium]
MQNIKLTIEYDGTRYCGWQKQKIQGRVLERKRKKPSVQETVESCLQKILKQKVNLVASGRTDSGVHAFGQVANFRTASGIFPDKVKSALNGNLPRDIRISNAEQVPWGFHSQYSTKSKIYRYLILNQEYKVPFFGRYTYWFKFPLNIKLMRNAARHLSGRHDFKVFCASGSGVKGTTRNIKQILINPLNIFSANLICIEVEADGFLYNMVRNIVGTLIDVGRGRFEPDYIKEIIRSKNRALAGFCVPARGLYLAKVNYPRKSHTVA